VTVNRHTACGFVEHVTIVNAGDRGVIWTTEPAGRNPPASDTLQVSA
jgi:hypothetical protein